MAITSFGNQIESARLLIDAGARTDDGELLIDRGVDVNGVNECAGGTALHAAASMRYTDDSSQFVRMLLDRGADPAVRSKGEKTALEIAIEGAKRQDEAKPDEAKHYEAVIRLLREAA